MMAVSVILPLMFFLVFMGVPIAVSIGAAALVGVYSLHGVPGFYNAALALFDGATSADRLRFGPDRVHARRSGDGQYRGVVILCRNFGFCGGGCCRDRFGPDPWHEAQGI